MSCCVQCLDLTMTFACGPVSGTKCKCAGMQQQQQQHIKPAELIYDLSSQRGPWPCQTL